MTAAVADNSEFNVSPIVRDVILGTLQVGVGFGIGCLTGKAVKGPVLLTGGIYALATLITTVFTKIAKHFAAKDDWKISHLKFTTALIGGLVAVATAVSLFALGVFGPIGLGVTLGLGGLFMAASLGIGLYEKYGNGDRTYSQVMEDQIKATSEKNGNIKQAIYNGFLMA